MRGTQSLPEYRDYLKGKYYGILRDYEKGQNYDKLLDSILIELLGSFKDFDCDLLNSLYSRTCALKYLKYKYFRDNIMSCMRLVDKIFVE